MAEKKEARGGWEEWKGMDIRKPILMSQWKNYSRELDARWKNLLSTPRVLKKSEIIPEQEGVPGRGVDTEKLGLRTLIAFFEDFPGGAKSFRHGHLNEAVFYILKGRGYEIHDGEKYDWEAGDVVIVPNGAVHCHINADPIESIQALVFNPKHVFLNMNLTAQRFIHLSEEIERMD